MFVMDAKIKAKQEIASELASQNEIDSSYNGLAVGKNNDTIEWYDFEIGMKTEIKQEAPVTCCFSHTERLGLTKDLYKKIKIDTNTFSSYKENGSKTVAECHTSGVCLENGRQFVHKDMIKKEKCSSDCEIEIKEEPWWLERTAEALSYCEDFKYGRNAAEFLRLSTKHVSQESAFNCDPPVRNDISLNKNPDSSEIKKTIKHDSDIRETFSNEEPLYSEHLSQQMDEKIHSTASDRMKDSYNQPCSSALVSHNLPDKSQNIYKCDARQKSFKQLLTLKRHSLAHEAVNLYMCQICKRTFTQLSKLKQHNVTHKGVKPHKCETCQRTFTRLSHLKQHHLIHEGIKPHKCELCDKSFTHLSHLKQHILMHQGVKPHKCETCQRSFTQMSHLKQHKLIHEGVKPHKCGICEKSFTHMSSLKQHILIHNGAAPHKCEICEKTFTQTSHLKQHSLIHDGVKPYKCEICKKTFTQMSHLKQHILSHNGIKPHKCKICEKTFTHLSNLKQHITIHKGVKPHKCEICEKGFTRMSSLKQHILIHKGDKATQI